MLVFPFDHEWQFLTSVLWKKKKNQDMFILKSLVQYATLALRTAHEMPI